MSTDGVLIVDMNDLRRRMSILMTRVEKCCPKCKGRQLALGGYRDRRRSVVLTGGEDEIELGVESRTRSER